MRYKTVLFLLLLFLAASPVRADFIFIPEEEPAPEASEPPVASEPASTGSAAATLPVEQVEPAMPAPATPQPEPAAAADPEPPVRPPVPVAQDTAAAAPLQKSAPPPAPAAPPAQASTPVAAAAPEPAIEPPAPVEEIQLDASVAVGAASAAPPLVTTVVTTVPTHQAAFDVRAGETVRTALQRWVDAAGWTLRWQADFDLRIEADNLFAEDELTEVVPLVLAAFRTPPGQKRLTATAYRGNRVLLIEGKVQP